MIASSVNGATPASQLEYVGLDKDDATTRIQPAGHVDARRVNDAPLHLGRVIGDRHGVIVHDAKDAVIVVQHGGPVFDGTQIVADVDGAAGLDATKHFGFFRHTRRSSVVMNKSVPLTG
jgi:hypothetical protein